MPIASASDSAHLLVAEVELVAAPDSSISGRVGRENDRAEEAER
jgi:hypothetical protein